MSIECRDWLKTLWAASFKGVPFYFASDSEQGGRDEVIHKFPHRDTPFIEDMGEAPRFFTGTAYIFGDDVDSQESALKAALVSPGAGTLVIPLGGPVVVWLQTFERKHEKDKLGYLAFELKFVREGSASALISIPYAQNIAFASADAMASTLASHFVSTISTLDQPDFVVAAAVDQISAGAAALDVIRTTYAVDPAVSVVLRDTLAGIAIDAPSAISNAALPGEAALNIAKLIITSARTLADAMSPATAARAMLDIIAGFYTSSAPPHLTPVALAAQANAAAAASLVRLAALTAYAEAILRMTYASRPDGVDARAEIADRFESELLDTTGAAYAALYLAIDDLRGKVIDYLSAIINDLAPIITVEVPRIMPALYLAWRLYADPLRDGELVARNNVRHPSFMPKVFSALSR